MTMPSSPPPAWSALEATAAAATAAGESMLPVLARFVRERMEAARDCVLFIESRGGAEWAGWETDLICCWYLVSDPQTAGGGQFPSLLSIVAAGIELDPDLKRKLPYAVSAPEFTVALGNLLAFSLEHLKRRYDPQKSSFVEWIAAALASYIRNAPGNERKAIYRRREDPLEGAALSVPPPQFETDDPNQCDDLRLTKSQFEVVRRLLDGTPLNEIAEELNIQVDTIKRHCRDAAKGIS
jgi:hypothetical protein